jgi:uncharacterized protein YacL
MRRTRKLSAEGYARILGGLAAAYIGWSISSTYAAVPPTDDQRFMIGLLTLVSIGFGLVLTPYLVVHPLHSVLQHAKHMPSLDLAATGIGVFLGLLAGVLLTFPLSQLPRLLGQYLPFGSALVCAYIGAVVVNWRKNDLLALIAPKATPADTTRRYLLDTSVIVDGRIAELAQTGVLDGTLLVPQFVLHEVQTLADSPDDLTRAKGKRGLHVLHLLQHEQQIPIAILDHAVPHSRAVDDALVALARAEQLWLVTNDANLQRVAELQQVKTINLHQVVDALCQPFMPGETLHIMIRQEGREREQGVGFLHDGTMVVVEDARRSIGQDVAVAVTRVYQTNTGRILFAQRM